MPEAELTAINHAAIQQWTHHPCGALEGLDESGLAFFEAVERNRYEAYAPWMRKFVNFSTYGGKRLLEVGVGLGTDLVQFAKAGADVAGIDITQRHLELAARNFEVRGLHADLQYAAAAAIPFENDSFDVVYSFGVLHCTDNTVRCLTECHRVLKPGGELILAMYYKYSFFHAYTIFVNGILRGRLRKLGYKGLMSLIEMRSRWSNICAAGQNLFQKSAALHIGGLPRRSIRHPASHAKRLRTIVAFGSGILD